MKITTKQYALSLFEAVKNKNAAGVKKAIERFCRILAASNDGVKLDRIVDEFNNIWNKEKGIVEAETVSARELNKDITELLYNYIIKLSGAKKIELEQKVDKSILGGVVIRHGDRVVDGSLRTRVEELKNKMVK